MAESEETNSERGWTRADWGALLLCAGIGLLLAVLPHLAMLAEYGTVRYLADYDDLLYLAVARVPAQGENSLRDPLTPPTENVPSLYAWFQFVPLAKLSAALGLPPILMNLLWRIVGGLLFGAALYALFRAIFRGLPHHVAWSVGCVLVCLADAGFSNGRMIVGNLSLLSNLWRGTTPMWKADALPQFRVVTPLLNLPFLLLLATALIADLKQRPRPANELAQGEPSTPSVRSASRRTWILTTLGAILLGLCFNLYFFFWTAAVAGIGLFLLITLIQAWRVPAERTTALARVKLCGFVLAGGLIVGAPQVYYNAKTFADARYQPILQRLSRGRDVATDPEARFRLLKNYWLWLKLGIGAAGILIFRMRRLTLVWCLALAGYALAASAAITHLEFENFHWSYVHAAFSEILVLGVLCHFLAPRWKRLSRGRYACWLAPLGLLAVALVWRPYEALHAPGPAVIDKAMIAVQPFEGTLAQLKPDCVLAGPEEANVAQLFSPCSELYQSPYTAQASVIPDLEVHERMALNAWLQEISLEDFLTRADTEPFIVGPSNRPGWQPEVIRSQRKQAFQAITADPAKYLERYRPTVLLLRSGLTPPAQSGVWQPAKTSGDWTLWVRP